MERVELSLDPVVSMLLGRFEKIELRFVNKSRCSDADEDLSRVVFIELESRVEEPPDREVLLSRWYGDC